MEAPMIDYDATVKDPEAFGYGWPKQKLQLYDLREDITSAVVGLQVLKQELNKDPKHPDMTNANKYLDMISTRIAEADELTRDLFNEASLAAALAAHGSNVITRS
jgi:hypothetical protein